MFVLKYYHIHTTTRITSHIAPGVNTIYDDIHDWNIFTNLIDLNLNSFDSLLAKQIF